MSFLKALFGIFVAVVAIAPAVVPKLMAPPLMPTPIPGASNQDVQILWPEWEPRAFGEWPLKEPRHPHMAAPGRAGIHSDGTSSDLHATGPTGRGRVKVRSRVGSKWPGGMCATLTFARDGKLIVLCASLAGFEMHLLSPRELQLLAVYPLPQRPSTFAALVTLNPKRIMLDTSGGAYYYLDNADRVVLADANQHIQRIAHRQKADGSWEFYSDADWDLNDHVPHDCLNYNNLFPRGACDPITAVTPDYAGNIWWVTRRGIVGLVNPTTGAVASLNLGEEMQNGITVGADGVFIVTDHALYCMEADARGTPSVVWREAYDRGTFQKVGMLSQGSGTAPTLFGNYVTINDNADTQVNIMLYWRNRSLTSTQQRVVCKHPLFAVGKSASDNSMIATGNSIIMENNFGYHNAIEQREWSRETIPGGIERVDVDPATGTCKTVWTNAERAPSCVAKLGVSVGLLYYQTFDEILADDGSTADVQWYLTAVDAHTGRTVFKVPTGRGRNYDNNWGPVTLGPDGTAYIGVLQGIVAIWDA